MGLDDNNKNENQSQIIDYDDFLNKNGMSDKVSMNDYDRKLNNFVNQPTLGDYIHKQVVQQKRRENRNERMYNHARYGYYMTDDEHDKFLSQNALYFLGLIIGAALSYFIGLPKEAYPMTVSIFGYAGAFVKRNGLEKMSIAESIACTRIELILVLVGIIITLILFLG